MRRVKYYRKIGVMLQPSNATEVKRKSCACLEGAYASFTQYDILIATHKIKLQAADLGIKKIDAHAQGGRLEFAKDTTVQPITIVQLVQKQPAQFKLDGAEKLRFISDLTDTQKRLSFVEQLLTKLKS